MGREMLSTAIKYASICLLCVLIQGCALFTHQLDDPNQILGVALNTEGLVKSLRCEIITFIVENRLRYEIWSEKTKKILDPKTSKIIAKNQQDFDDIASIVKTYPFINLDETQYAALGIDLKNINTVTVNTPNDWKNSYKNSPVTRDYHIGPSIAETDTFEYVPPLAIPQNADLGPAVSYNPPDHPKLPGAARFSTIYFYHPKNDAKNHYYCYKSLAHSSSSTLIEAATDVQLLLTNEDRAPDFTNFDRIYVGKVTLANWLQNMAKQLNYNSHTILPTPENVLVGQIAYTFTLDVKPSIDLKYTYMANVISPFAPELSAGVEHSGQFSIYLNTPQSVPATQAKGGNSCNNTVSMETGTPCQGTSKK
jgi:hypothetical protein